ncbi:MAG TPA: STAS domain-containing protein [Solirubrobacterales bacterium]|nr:STAS domain-containing protein [Solirubrobacterales bacterium]
MGDRAEQGSDGWIAPRAYSWLGPGDLYRERLVEVVEGDSPDPALRCAGEFDAAGAAELEAALAELTSRPIERLRLDLTQVEFLDGYVLGLIAATQLRLERRGVPMAIDAVGQPLRMLELSGLDISATGSDRPAERRSVTIRRPG